jgi:SAM-dependent methyltransferase
MSDERIELNRLNWDERARIHARDTTGDYRLDRFRAGEDALHAIEAAELGDITGKRVLHLQCHIGRDTLCLSRRGATRVVGLDFSPDALAVARRLAQETRLRAEFVLGSVYDAQRLAPGPFDLVFTTWGTIVWLPDLKRWASQIAAVLVPGGELYFADAHPSFLAMDEREGTLVPTYDFQTPEESPLIFEDMTTYTGDPTPLVNRRSCQWVHSLSSVIGSLLEAGLAIEMLREHEVLPWQGVKMLVPVDDRLWRLPDGHPRMPLSFSLRARKPQR